MAKITKRTVDALAGQERERVVWDDDQIKGFGVRVHPTGRKVYIVKTRYRGRVIKMTIGPHGAVTPSYARVRAAEIITDARAGKNPAGRNADAPTMIALGKRFLKEYVSTHCKPSTAEEYRRSVKLFIDPRVGRYRVPDIQRSDIAALHHDMRDTPYQANRTLGVLSKMFNLAELWDLRPDGTNPCRACKEVPGGEARAVSIGYRVSTSGRSPESDRGGRFGDGLSHCRGPVADADRVPSIGDTEAALGACRSGGE